jgi:hypothetical protein
MPNDNKLRWYYVAADYENVHLNENLRKHLWERRVFVFRASKKDAAKTALKIAKEQEYDFKNSDGNRIDVKFRGIESTSELLDQRLVSGV